MKSYCQADMMGVLMHVLLSQVSLGGLEHGLTPLAASCASMHVIDAPLLFLDALWLPYRRDRQELVDAIQAAGPVKAIFGHTDVVSMLVMWPVYTTS